MCFVGKEGIHRTGVSWYVAGAEDGPSVQTTAVAAKETPCPVVTPRTARSLAREENRMARAAKLTDHYPLHPL
jgi:hypothetical protein